MAVAADRSRATTTVWSLNVCVLMRTLPWLTRLVCWLIASLLPVAEIVSDLISVIIACTTKIRLANVCEV